MGRVRAYEAPCDLEAPRRVFAPTTSAPGGGGGDFYFLKFRLKAPPATGVQAPGGALDPGGMKMVRPIMRTGSMPGAMVTS